MSVDTTELRKLAEAADEYQYTDGHIRAVYASGALESKNELFKDIRKAHFDEWLRRHDAKLLLRAVVAEEKITRALEALNKSAEDFDNGAPWDRAVEDAYDDAVRILTEGDPE